MMYEYHAASIAREHRYQQALTTAHRIEDQTKRDQVLSNLALRFSAEKDHPTDD
jgi:hypothetical protein